MATEYSSSVEFLCGCGDSMIVRIHEGNNGKYGDAFVWSCTVSRSGTIAILKGATAPPPNAAVIRAGNLALKVAGFTHRLHQRYGDHRVRHILKAL